MDHSVEAPVKSEFDINTEVASRRRPLSAMMTMTQQGSGWRARAEHNVHRRTPFSLLYGHRVSDDGVATVV
jgi:hypothetical protein